MLTTTYAFLSLSTEQKRVHNLLSSAQQLLHSFANRQRLDAATLTSVIDQFAKLDGSCHRRKIETYVIPAVQQATQEANLLLAELQASNTIARQLLDSVQEWVRLSLAHSAIEITEFYALIERYCNVLLERLAKEEKELLPLAQRVLSNDAWFAIGAQFLSTDVVRKPLSNHIDRFDSDNLALSDALMTLVVGGNVIVDQTMHAQSANGLNC
ncbi:hemerythrin domain-containing protein [Glaciimonas sp. GG7]